jgi:hypothetical protein
MCPHTEEVKVEGETTLRNRSQQLLIEVVNNSGLVILVGYQDPVDPQVGNEVLSAPMVCVKAGDDLAKEIRQQVGPLGAGWINRRHGNQI